MTDSTHSRLALSCSNCCDWAGGEAQSPWSGASTATADGGGGAGGANLHTPERDGYEAAQASPTFRRA